MIALHYTCPGLDKKNMATREGPLPRGSAKPVNLIKLISEDENSYFDLPHFFMASDSRREQFWPSLTFSSNLFPPDQSQHRIEEFIEIFKRKTFAVKHSNNFRDRIY